MNQDNAAVELRDRIAEALYERERPPRDPHWAKTFASDRETFEAMADAVLPVLPAPAEPPLSPYYEHPACGFHWHGSDGMDTPMRDGQPVCPRCELAKVEKKLAGLQRRRDEVGAECKRRGKRVLEQSERILALERQVDEVHRQLGTEILRAGQAEAELRRLAAEAPATVCAECGHPHDVHIEREEPVSVGRCTACPSDGEEWHDYEPGEAPATNTQAAASPSNRRALVHNAITDALSAAGDWVPLSVRVAATRAALAEVDAWHAVDDPAVVEPAEAADTETRCTCADAGASFAPAGHYADCPATETVHGCPPDGSGLTPCCGRTPFELPLTDRISSEAPTTCPGAQS